MGTVLQAIDSLGSFWIPGIDDDVLDGRLIFDPDDGGRLELVGTFKGARAALNDRQFLHGVIDSGNLSLDNCFFQGTTSRSSGLDTSRFYINSLILGRHLDPASLNFRTLHLRTAVGNDWVGKRIGDVERLDGVAEDVAPWLNYARPSDQVANFSRGEVVLGYAWKNNGSFSPSRVTFEHWPVFSIRYRDQTSLDVVKDDAGHIADLITLCADEIATLDTLSVSDPDLRVRMLSGADGPVQELEVLAPQVSYTQPIVRKQRHSHEMLLTYDELGGIAAVARWVEICSVFGRALASMVSVRRARGMFAENRFLNIASAAEAFHRDMYGGEAMPADEFRDMIERCLNAVPEARRDWLQNKIGHSNDPTFRRRLSDLVARTGGLVGNLHEDPQRWVDTLTRARNHLTHLDSSKLNVDGGDLYFLGESLFAVVRACMLIEVGVPRELVQQKASAYAFSWYRERLAESVTRVRAGLRESSAPSVGGAP